MDARLGELNKRNNCSNLREGNTDDPFDQFGSQLCQFGSQIGFGHQIGQIDVLRSPDRARDGFRLLVGEAGGFEFFDGLVGVEGADHFVQATRFRRLLKREWSYTRSAAAFSGRIARGRRRLRDAVPSAASRTGGRFGNWAINSSSPPIALMKSRKVDTYMSLRVSIFEMASWPTLSRSATAVWVLPIALRSLCNDISSAINSRARASILARSSLGRAAIA